MDARLGDRLLVRGRQVGMTHREGEVIEVIHAGGSAEHYRVRWSDGRESIVFPGTDATVVRPGDEGAESSTMPASAVETRAVVIELRLEEDDERCAASAMLATSSRTFTGSGRARRNPSDRSVPMIGEELAIARALEDLAQQLTQAASSAMASGSIPPVHLVP